MKVLIVGTGGIGGYYGGLLARGGCDVTFLARGKHFQELQKSGLRVKSVIGDFEIKPVQVALSAVEAGIPDLILVCVKTYDTEEISRSLAPISKKNTVVIPLQNGIDNDQVIQKYLPESIVVPGLTYIVSTRTSPGVIEQTAGSRNIIFGSRDGQHQQALSNIEKTMRDAGIEATNSEAIERELWIKFLWIVAFAGMTSLCRSAIGPIVTDPGTWSLYKRCLNEAFLVAKKLGIDVGNEEYESIIQKVEKYKHSGSDSKSSMLVDIENHRHTEIESIHGKLCQLAKEAGIDVPINETIYHAIRLTHLSPTVR